MSMLDEVLRRIDSRRGESLEQLKEFLRIASISAKPEHKLDMQRCAQWVADKLESIGFSARIEPTDGQPLVLAANEHEPGRPTVLFYGHYDVQPAEPLELWTSPPFEPTVRKTEAGTDAVYARGAVDDKGQVWAHIEAMAAWQAHGGVPVNVILLIEGEEEIGSPSLAKFLTRKKSQLQADIALISDTDQFDRGLPAITYGLRGLCYAEIFLTGPDHDLHSGLYGGSVPNPANVLCEFLASMHDHHGRVNLPGFYDDVVELSAIERQLWRKLPFSEQQMAASIGISHGNGEAGYSALEQQWARPTL